MKNLIYTDIHAANIYSFNVKRSKHLFSEYSRIDELYSTLDWIMKVTKELDVTMPINLGDTFHQALRFYIERYNFVVRSIININQSSLSKTGVIVEGNHDRTDDVSAVDTFENVQGTMLVKNSIKVKYISEINSHFIFVPYIRDPVKTKEAFETLYKKFKGSKSNLYIFCHLDLKEAFEGLITSTYQLAQYNSYDDLKLNIYNAIFSGHLHWRQKIKNNFYYVGSTLNHNFGDKLERKGITILDFTADGYTMKFRENPYCPLFVKVNLQKEQDKIKKMKFIEKEIEKYPYTNVYTRIYTLNNGAGKEATEEFLRDFNHLFTFYEIKSLDSEEEIDNAGMISIKMENINIFDLVIDHGSKILSSNGKTNEEIERYVTRLRRLCLSS